MANIIIKDPEKNARQARTMQQELEVHRAFEGAAHQAKKHVTPEEAGIDIRTIVWPSEKKPGVLDEYDFYHHKWTTHLAIHIAEGFETPLSPRELKVLRSAAMLHDLGREEGWRSQDPHHAERSARLAHDHMIKTPLWADRELVNEVCTLIKQHSLSRAPTSPMLLALHDAECFESARLAPSTMDGIQNMAKRMDQCITPWARLLEHQRRWRDMRGLKAGG